MGQRCISFHFDFELHGVQRSANEQASNLNEVDANTVAKYLLTRNVKLREAAMDGDYLNINAVSQGRAR